MKNSENSLTGYHVIIGEVADVSQIKTVFKKNGDGSQSTEVAGFSQDVVIYVPQQTNEFGEIERKAQMYPVRVWHSKSSDKRFMPVGLIGRVKVKCAVDGQRFIKVDPATNEKKTMYFVSISMFAWVLLQELSKRPIVDAVIAPGVPGTDETPF